MTHYICTGGCGAVTDAPSVCRTNDCHEYNHQLTPCDCADSQHYGKLKKSEAAPAEEVKQEKKWWEFWK